MALTKLAYNGDSKIIKNLVNQVNQLIDGGGGGGASSLVDLDDTSISSPTNGQVLEYDSQTSKWKNANPPASGVEDVKVDGVSVVTQGVANLTTPDLDDLESVTISSPTNGQVLKYNNTTQKWENADESGGGGGGGSLSRTELFKSQNENAVWDNNGIALSDDIENYDDVEIVSGFTNAGTSDRAKQTFRYNSKWFADNFAYISSSNPNCHALVLLWTGQGFSLGWDDTNKKIMMWSQNGSAGIWAVYGIKYGGSGGGGSAFVEEELATASSFSNIAVDFSTDYDEFIFYANDVTTQKSESYTYTRNEITDAINNNFGISFYPFGSGGYCQYSITRNGLQAGANKDGFYIYKIIGLKFGGGSGGGHVIIDENDTEVAQEPSMQFAGKVSVTDDATNEKTVVTFPEEVKEVTLAEYEAIPVAERESNGIAYFIKDLNNESVQGYPPLIYSDEEREIGVWRDGKPLYQITFTQQLSGITGNIDISALNAETALIVDGYYDIGVTNIGLNEWLSNGNYSYTHVNNELSPPYIDCYCTWSNSTITVTLQYTKTTDTAGSGTWNGQGGIAHHYSTNETVIGTWIDGKPLYEKTFNVNTSIAQNTTYVVGDTTGLDIVNVSAIALTSSTSGFNIPYYNGTSEQAQLWWSSNELKFYQKGYTITGLKITIQYTKTTD